MSMTRPTLIGVFDEPTMADNAVNALTNAGFDTDAIYNSGHTASSGFFAELKRLFSGEDTTNTAADLKDLGLTSEEANYYQNEHRAGRRIVAVNAAGREQEALSVLQGLGGRIYGTKQDADAYANNSAAANAYQNDANAAAGTYQNDRTAANAYQNDANAAAGTYQNDRTAANTYQNDAAASEGYTGQANPQARREEARLERREEKTAERERFDSERNQDNNNY